MKRRTMKSAPRMLVALAAAGTCAAPAGASALPFFTEVPNAFGAQPCAKAGCYTNYLRVTDIDGDGDLDVLFPNADGYFKKGTPSPFVIYTNDSKGIFTNVSATAVGGFSGYLRQIAVGDVDGDGDPDIYAPAAWGDPDAFFINVGKAIFKDEAATRNPGVASHAGAARFGDIDNDGDLDLFLSDGWASGQMPKVPVHLYLNDGTGHFAEAMDLLPKTTSGIEPIDFDLFDADRDFDLDLLVDLHRGQEALWLNDGTGHFAAAPLPPPTGTPLTYDPVTCDVDGDGDLDIWIDNAGPAYTEQLLINDGSASFTDQTAARVTGNIAGADDNGVACVDVDGDGDFDAVVASLSDEERILINDGTGHFSRIAGGFTPKGDATLWIELGDMNGDGRLDAVTGQGETGSFLDRFYAGSVDVAVDTRPPAIIKVEPVAGVIEPVNSPVVRFAVSDNATSDDGPRLKRAYLKISAPTPSEVEARFVGGDLFRGVLPAEGAGAIVKFAACATDQQGNDACGPEQSYTVSGSTGDSSSSVTGSSSASSSAESSASSGAESSASSGGGSGQASAGGAHSDGVGGASSGGEQLGGCGCAVFNDRGGENLAVVAFVGALAAVRRRRRMS
jgi:MYXO-CTERM domain-containing protein